MSSMFCYQCEQTSHGVACVEKSVCGKSPETAAAQDRLSYELLRLATVLEGSEVTESNVLLLLEGLFTCVTNVSFDEASCNQLTAMVVAALEATGAGDELLEAVAGPDQLFAPSGVEASCRALLVLGLRGMAAYAHHARMLGYRYADVDEGLVRFLAAAGRHHSVEEWLALLNDFGLVNFRCLELLDAANTGSYGDPAPTRVSMDIEAGPFIVVTGHDLHDMKMLLEQCKGSGVSVYTHGEMLPAHAYPELARYAELKGHFGTAWQNQQREFADAPGAFLFTTNCLMPPRPKYASNIFTTSMVRFPGTAHVQTQEQGHKDFSSVIARAKELGGWKETQHLKGINGGGTLTTGFGHAAVLGVADQMVEAIKKGAVKHIYLVGGCDGREPGRNYYTELVKQTPPDSLVLTLACGKFRFNDLDLGAIGPFPRVLDMGQCNDAYSAVKVAMALADVFGCDINELPLSIKLSWYEQKAVCVLLSLLALGVKNIQLGPALPAFVSPEVYQVLNQKWGLHPISTPAQDLVPLGG